MMGSHSKASKKSGLTILPKTTSCLTTTSIKPHTISGYQLEAKQHTGNQKLFSLYSFEAKSSEVLILVGNNGSGKTTLLKNIVGEPALPVTGQLLIDGLPINKTADRFTSGLMAWLPQHKSPVFDATALQHVLMGRYRFKHFWEPYSKEDHEIAYSLLDQVGLANRANDLMVNLSGGEQQLVWLAQLQAQDADIILLDEPTQYLDLRNQYQIINRLFDWALNHNKLVIFSTHDLHLLEGRKATIIYLRPDQSIVGPCEPEMLKSITRSIISAS